MEYAAGGGGPNDDRGLNGWMDALGAWAFAPMVSVPEGRLTERKNRAFVNQNGWMYREATTCET